MKRPKYIPKQKVYSVSFQSKTRPRSGPPAKYAIKFKIAIREFYDIFSPHFRGQCETTLFSFSLLVREGEAQGKGGHSFN